LLKRERKFTKKKNQENSINLETWNNSENPDNSNPSKESKYEFSRK